MSAIVATFFGVGHLRPAPGTWGSLAALPAGWLVIVFAGPWGLAIAAALAFAAGLWATARETAGSDDHDPSEIVIDEVAGQWIALLPIAYGAAMMSVQPLRLWPGWIVAFALCRLFDITKPWLVGWADRRGDPLGVMLDDIIAGLFAAIGVVALAALTHTVLM